ncbi:hypothetical protein BH11ARM2_BH11ARM2_39250 [soil metagenome]
MGYFGRCALLFLLLVATASALAGTPVAAGTGANVSADGTDLPDTGFAWQLKTSTGTNIANDTNARGWSVAYASATDQITVAVPANATARDDVKVLYRDGATGESAIIDVLPVSIVAADTNPAPSWSEAQATDEGAGGEAGPSGGDSIDVATGVHTHAPPESDLTVYNPFGPGVEFRRIYRSTFAAQGISSPGLPVGWVEGYWYQFTTSADVAWNPLTLVSPTGSRETFAPVLNNGVPTGQFTSPPGVPYRLTGTPNAAVGRWNSLILTHRDRSKWAFQRLSSTQYLLFQIADAEGRYIQINRGTGQVLKDVTDDSGTRIFRATYVNNLITKATDLLGARRTDYAYAQEAGGTVLKQVSVVADTSVTSPQVRWQYAYASVLGQPLMVSAGAPDASSPNNLIFNAIAHTPQNGRVSTFADADGDRTTYTYKSTSTPVTKANASGSTAISYIALFDSQKRSIGFKDAATKSTAIVYGDSANPYQPTSFANRLNQTEGYEYDADGNVVSSTDRRGVKTRFTYDRTTNPFGDLATVTRDILSPTTYEHDALGHVIRIKGPIPGVVGPSEETLMEFDYNENGDVIQARRINAAGGLSFTYLEYETDTDPVLGDVTTPARRNQPLRITDPLNRTWHFRYDARGNLLRMKDPLGNVTDYLYNSGDQLIRITDPPTGQTGTGRAWTAYVYDTVGGALKSVSRYDEGGTGNPVYVQNVGYTKEADPNALSGTGDPVSTPKDALGRPAKSIDGNNKAVSATYANIGALSRVTRPAGQKASLVLNAEGEPITLTNARSELTTFTRAADDSRITGIGYGADASLNVSTSYNTLNRLLSITDTAATRTYSYDDLGNVLQENTTFKDLTGTYGIAYTYNPDGSLHTMDTAAALYTYGYDANGNQTSIEADWKTAGIPTLTVTITYDALGRLKSHRTNTYYTTISYNAVGQITSRQVRDLVTGDIRVNFTSVTYDGAGRLLSANIDQPHIGSASALSGVLTLAYDTDGHLMGEVRTLTGGSQIYPGTPQPYGYDAAGNRTQARGRPFSYNPNSEVTGDASIAYDAQGNLIKLDNTPVGVNAADGYTGNGRYVIKAYADGRKAKKTVAGSGRESYYVYDQFGNVALEISGVNGRTSPVGSVYGAYVTGSGGVHARLSASPSEVTNYAYDLFGNVLGRYRGSGTAPATSEVYDSEGKAWVRYNTAAATAPPVIDPVSSFGQYGANVEEEDRASDAARYIILDGDIYDPQTGLSFAAPTSTTRRQRTMQALVGIARGGLLSLYKGFSWGVPGSEKDLAGPNAHGRTKIERQAARFGESTADGIAMFAGVGGGAVGAIKSAPKQLVKEFAHVAPTQGHHPIPKYLGGFEEQYLYHVNKDFHSTYHRELNQALYQEFGYYSGGVKGSTAVWHRLIGSSQAPWTDVVAVIEEVNRSFDAQNGTIFSTYFNMMMKAHRHMWP